MKSAAYISFRCHETVELRDISDIPDAIDRIIEAYDRLNQHGDFTYRLLLPKGENTTTKTRTIGLIVQAELLLRLKKKRLKPNIKEVRYNHDETHYGWILASPEKIDASSVD
jgi:hypothetical protein